MNGLFDVMVFLEFVHFFIIFPPEPSAGRRVRAARRRRAVPGTLVPALPGVSGSALRLSTDESLCQADPSSLQLSSSFQV